MDEATFAKALGRNMEGWSGFLWDCFLGLRVNGISGDYVEFGSEGANTLSRAHDAIQAMGVPRHLWAFDSFEGLPPAADPRDDHPMWRPGMGSGLDRFHELCAGYGVPRDAYTAVVGYYEDTLPTLGDGGAPTDIALAYVDCNMYSSTVEVLRFLRPRLKHGMVVAFDDYFCWSSREPSGERVALLEFEAANPQWHFLHFKDFNWSGRAFVVEDAGRLPAAATGASAASGTRPPDAQP
jgi:hypothetical protein